MSQSAKRSTRAELSEWRRYPSKKIGRALRRQRTRQHIDAVKLKSGCQACTERDVALLDFHHKITERKRFSLRNATRHGYSISAIDAEIANCAVLCSNCHRRVHAVLKMIDRNTQLMRELLFHD